MAETKTIVSTITLHVPGPRFMPFEFSDAGFVKKGKYDVIHAKPGTPVVLPEVEADRLIARGIATVYVAPEATPAPATVDATGSATANGKK